MSIAVTQERPAPGAPSPGAPAPEAFAPKAPGARGVRPLEALEISEAPETPDVAGRRRSLRLFARTETLENDMAPAAIIGLSSHPVNG